MRTVGNSFDEGGDRRSVERGEGWRVWEIVLVREGSGGVWGELSKNYDHHGWPMRKYFHITLAKNSQQ